MSSTKAVSEISLKNHSGSVATIWAGSSVRGSWSRRASQPVAALRIVAPFRSIELAPMLMPSWSASFSIVYANSMVLMPFSVDVATYAACRMFVPTSRLRNGSPLSVSTTIGASNWTDTVTFSPDS